MAKYYRSESQKHGWTQQKAIGSQSVGKRPSRTEQDLLRFAIDLVCTLLSIVCNALPNSLFGP